MTMVDFDVIASTKCPTCGLRIWGGTVGGHSLTTDLETRALEELSPSLAEHKAVHS